MKILFDMQGLQSAYKRGIGNYALSALKSVVKNNLNHEILVLLNNNIETGKREIYREIRKYIDSDKIFFFSAPRNISIFSFPSKSKLQASEMIYSRVISQINPDVLHIFSAFSSFDDDSITSIDKSNITPVSVTLYDLIPYLMSEHYLVNDLVKERYMGKFSQLSEAQLLLSISESSKMEALQFLDVNQNQVINVSCDASEYFNSQQVERAVLSKLKHRLGISKKFVAYVSFTDFRKNNHNLISAFSLLSKELRKHTQLVIICQISEVVKQELQRHAENCGLSPNDIIFTGYVRDDELVGLYQACSLFVFPSLHEGFGLPILEAMRCGAAVIGSNTTSIPEIIGDDRFTFNPNSPKSIAEKIEKFFVHKDFYKEVLANSHIQEKRFSWDVVAKRIIGALEGLGNEFSDRKNSSQSIKALDEFVDTIHYMKGLNNSDIATIVKALNENERAFSKSYEPQIFIDVSVFRFHDAGTGISRTVKMLSKHFYSMSKKYIVRAVYDNGDGYSYASKETCEYLEFVEYCPDTVIDVNADDIFLGIDLHLELAEASLTFLERHRLRGMKVYFLVYDLVLVKFKEHHGLALSEIFNNWLRRISSVSNGLIAISKTVMKETESYIHEHLQDCLIDRPFKLDFYFFHLGTELKHNNHLHHLKEKETITFLMVGWIDPRKGHIDVIEAVSILWRMGIDIELIIVGRVNNNAEHILDHIYSHTEYGKRLQFLGQVDDNTLEVLYNRSDALVAASLDEGFCLPIIEAAALNLPLILRDIPIFREVAIDNGYYFSNSSPEFIAEDIHKWIDLYTINAHPSSHRMPFQSWRNSAQQLASIVIPH